MEDDEIVSLFFQLDQQALKECEQKFGKRLIGLANRILNNQEDSQECVNDVMFSAWQTIPPQQPQSLMRYLGRLTRSSAIDLWRKKHSEKRCGGQYALCLDELDFCVAKNGSPEEQINLQELSASISAWLKSQPEQTRRIFILRYYHLVPIHDISARLGCTEAKIKSSLFRSRKSLRHHLIKEGLIV
jgi:RNA polymerase sigma-70 factor (ECF subfamily)